MQRLAARWKWFGAMAVAAVVLDQASKLWARRALVPGRPVAFVDGYWDWQLSFNHGASFNLLQSQTGARVVLSIIATVAVVAIGWMVHRARDDQRWTVAALGLVAGGALGNLIDRIGSGVVTDFALWHWNDRAYWPMFNVADAALVVGAGILLIAGMRKAPGAQRAAPAR
jgi:signal peptidase II